VQLCGTTLDLKILVGLFLKSWKLKVYANEELDSQIYLNVP
jgi:hypothetical protein